MCEDPFRWKSNKPLSLRGIYFQYNHPFRSLFRESKSDAFFIEKIACYKMKFSKKNDLSAETSSYISR